MEPEEVLDRWFNSEAWLNIQEEGVQGCESSLELMEQVNEQLCSLIFHLQNETSGERLLYELSYFNNLCDEFGVA